MFVMSWSASQGSGSASGDTADIRMRFKGSGKPVAAFLEVRR